MIRAIPVPRAGSQRTVRRNQAEEERGHFVHGTSSIFAGFKGCSLPAEVVSLLQEELRMLDFNEISNRCALLVEEFEAAFSSLFSSYPPPAAAAPKTEFSGGPQLFYGNSPSFRRTPASERRQTPAALPTGPGPQNRALKPPLNIGNAPKNAFIPTTVKSEE